MYTNFNERSLVIQLNMLLFYLDPVCTPGSEQSRTVDEFSLWQSSEKVRSVRTSSVIVWFRFSDENVGVLKQKSLVLLPKET